jgi:hypothetical protein
MTYGHHQEQQKQNQNNKSVNVSFMPNTSLEISEILGEACKTNTKKNSVVLVREGTISDSLCGLAVRVPGYRTEMYCDYCEARTEFIYVMMKKVDRLRGLVLRVPGYRYRGFVFDSRRYQIFW